MMWIMNAFTWITIASVSWWGIREVVRLSMKHQETMTRLKLGYPMNDDTRELPGHEKMAGYIDTTKTTRAADNDYQHRN